MKVVSVLFAGADLTCKPPRFTYIQPGETLTVPFEGALPETDRTTLDVAVTFMLIGSVTPLNTKTYTFTVQNGSPAVYDETAPFMAAQYPSALEASMPANAFAAVKKSGMLDVFILFFNIFVGMLQRFKTVY